MDDFIALVAHERSDMPFEPKHREKLQRLARNEGSCCKEGRSAAMAQGGPLRGHGKEGRSAAMGPWQGRSAAVTGEAAPRPADTVAPILGQPFFQPGALQERLSAAVINMHVHVHVHTTAPWMNTTSLLTLLRQAGGWPMPGFLEILFEIK